MSDRMERIERRIAALESAGEKAKKASPPCSHGCDICEKPKPAAETVVLHRHIRRWAGDDWIACDYPDAYHAENGMGPYEHKTVRFVEEKA